MDTPHVDRGALQRLPQKDLILQVHMLRLFVRSMNMYPQEHPILLELADRLVGQLCEAHRAFGALWFDARGQMLALNERTVDKPVAELQESVELAAWMRERGVQTLLVTGVLLADDLLDVFGWLNATDAEDCRDAIERGERPQIKGPLVLNPVFEAPPQALPPTQLPAPDPTPSMGAVPVSALEKALLDDSDETIMFAERALTAVEEEDTLSGESRYGQRNRDAAIQEGLMDAVRGMFTGPFGPEGLLSSLLAAGDPVAALVDELRARFPQRDRATVQTAVQAEAVVALAALKAPDLADFLGRVWREDSPPAALRGELLLALEENPLLALEVIGKLGNAVFGGTTGEGSGPAIEVLEAHVPWLLRAGQRREAVRAVQVLDRLVHDEQRTRSLRQRADIGLRRISRTGVVRSLLLQLKSMPGGDPETEELLYLMGSRSVARMLEDLQQAEERVVRMDLVDVLTVIGRMAQAHGDDPDEVLAPLSQTLAASTRPPWYLVRNVVLVLGNVGTPAMREQLEARLREEQDSRVLSEIALGLMNSASPETLKLLGSTLLGGRLASPDAFRGLLPALLEHDRKGTFKGLGNLLRGGALSEPATRVALETLIEVLGEQSEPVLLRVFSARPLFRRTLVFPESVRLAAVEALGGAQGNWVQALLERAQKDPSSRVRDRIVALRVEDAATGVFRPVPDEPGG